MVLNELRIDNLRAFESVELELAPGWNAFVGANGAGKTSVLEAVYLLSHGRSFRASSRDAVTRQGSPGFSVFGRLTGSNQRERRLGLARVNGRLDARVDGESVGLAELVQSSAVICFEPGSHELINGGAEIRRRAMDWGVFHVEHEFLRAWRRYQRALRQRNALLRESNALQLLDPWEAEMTESGEKLTTHREAYFAQLHTHILELLTTFLPELGQATCSFERGWKEDHDLQTSLRESRDRDRDRGHTSRGPHRADWSIGFPCAPRREHLSRGQQKLCALAFGLAQARCYAQQRSEWPILCFDDMAAELDQQHQAQLIDAVHGSGAQVLLSGTQHAVHSQTQTRVFHVEQGRIHPLV